MENLSSCLVKFKEFIKARDPFLFAAFIWLLYLATLMLSSVAGPVQAQIEEYSDIVNEFPLVKSEMQFLRKNIDYIKDEQKVQGEMLRESQKDIKSILKKMK